jgi:hypothetical protein
MMEGDALAWLLEASNPSARYLALTVLLDYPADDPQVADARASIPERGPARAILDAQWPAGYWMRPGVGYSPKHKATVWQVIFLAALGAPRTEALNRACAHVIEHSRLENGLFSAYKTATGAVACLNGNLLRAMHRLDYTDPRLDQTLEALAVTAVQDGFRCRFNASSPPPARMADGLPCAWGAIKALAAFAQVPEKKRSATVQSAVEIGLELLSSPDLPAGSYPTATRPSPLWQRFGFPLGYSSDILEALEVLGQLNVRRAPSLSQAVEVVLNKQDRSGRWALEHTPDNTWADFGRVGTPNKWVTIRALRALRDWR